MRRFFLFLVIISVLLISNVFPQTRAQRLKEARLQIDSLLSSSGHGPFQTVDEIVDIDSSIGNPGISGGNIFDPYETLKNCFLFIVRSNGENGYYEIGVFKNYQIIWMSGQLPGSDHYADYLQGDQEFLAVNDINKTGKVDFVVSFSGEGAPPQNDNIWIYSWDGANGECINQREDDGSTGLVSECSFDIKDIDGDGIDEILACSEQGSMDIAYSWNGSSYGQWSDSPNLTGKTFTTANNLIAKVSADIIRENDLLRYTYVVENSSTSQQSIGSLYVSVSTDSLSDFYFPNDWDGGLWTGHRLFDCFTEKDSSLIKPGFSLDSIYFSSPGLPVISKYYIQSLSYKLNYNTMDPDSLDTMYYNNVLSNSYTGYTIGAADPPSPFIQINFLDSLISYKHQALSLGWIDNQGIVNSLDSKLDNARKKLAVGDINAAKNILNAFVNEVEAQKGKHLTSEAYALLKYNAEYLIGRLK